MPLYNPGILATGGSVTGNLTETGNGVINGTLSVGGNTALAANMVVGSATALGDNGVGELQLATVTSVPTTFPTGGLVMYANAADHLVLLTPDGQSVVVGGVLTTVTSTTTVASSAALTALQSATIKAGDPVVGSSFRMTGYGVYSVTGTPTLTFALYWGGIAGTAIAAVPAITAASGIANAPFHYVALVNFRSTTSCTADIQLDLDTSASTDAATSYVGTPTAATTVTTNTDNALTMGFTWGTSSASNTISLLGGNVELVR